MSLPTRKYYTIETAAKRLDVDVEEIKYHLSEGAIRYAFRNPDKEDSGWVKFSQLSDVAKNCIYECVRRKDWVIHNLFKEHGVDRLVPDDDISPEFLYLPSSFPSAYGSNIGVMNEGDDYPWASAIMELLNGEQVVRLVGGHPHYFITGDMDEHNVFLSAVITGEELANFEDMVPVPQSEPEPALETEPEPEPEPEEKWQPFSYGQRNSGGLTSEAIVVFGNSFYEEHKKVPSDRELWDYMNACKTHSNYKIKFLREQEGVYKDIKVNNETAIPYEAWEKRVKRKRNTIPPEIKKRLKI